MRASGFLHGAQAYIFSVVWVVKPGDNDSTRRLGMSECNECESFLSCEVEVAERMIRYL